MKAKKNRELPNVRRRSEDRKYVLKRLRHFSKPAEVTIHGVGVVKI